MSRHAYHTRHSRPDGPRRGRGAADGRHRRWTDRLGLGVLRRRWSNAMPKFFKRMMWVCGLISGTALAAHESMAVAGIQPHAWWLDIEPYLVAIPAGAMFACKFTQSYDRNGNPVKEPLPEVQQPPAVNDSDIETSSPIDPVNDLYP